MIRFALAPLAGALLMTVTAAQAGTAPAARVTGQLTIADSGGYSWNLDFSNLNLLSIDAATGNIVVNTAVAAAGVNDGQGLWSVGANPSGDNSLKIVTSKGQVINPDTVLTWHSWLRADGTLGTDTAGGTNPWRSSFSFYAAGNVDPDMSYGFVAKNSTGATQTYSYTQGESLVPSVAGAYSLYADVSGSVNNVVTSGTPSLTLAPTVANGNYVQQVLLGNGSTATFNAGVGVGDALTVATAGTSTYGTFASTATGTGNYDYWEFQTQFTLTGGKDLAQVTGYAELTPVPEPSSYLMLALGLGLMGGRIHRNKR